MYLICHNVVLSQVDGMYLCSTNKQWEYRDRTKISIVQPMHVEARKNECEANETKPKPQNEGICLRLGDNFYNYVLLWIL